MRCVSYFLKSSTQVTTKPFIIIKEKHGPEFIFDGGSDCAAAFYFT